MNFSFYILILIFERKIKLETNALRDFLLGIACLDKVSVTLLAVPFFKKGLTSLIVGR